MKKKFFLFIAFVVLIDMAFVVFWYGISVRWQYQAGPCEIKVKDYVVEPKLKKWYYCSIKDNCSEEDYDPKLIAKYRILACLCRDSDTYQKEIQDFVVAELNNQALAKDRLMLCRHATAESRYAIEVIE